MHDSHVWIKIKRNLEKKHNEQAITNRHTEIGFKPKTSWRKNGADMYGGKNVRRHMISRVTKSEFLRNGGNLWHKIVSLLLFWSLFCCCRWFHVSKCVLETTYLFLFLFLFCLPYHVMHASAHTRTHTHAHASNYSRAKVSEQIKWSIENDMIKSGAKLTYQWSAQTSLYRTPYPFIRISRA